MKELNIEIAVKIYDYEELDAADRELMDAAREATNRSYAPYSHFSVGAAARLANGIVGPAPTRKTPPILPGCVQNVPPYSMPTPNIPTRR